MPLPIIILIIALLGFVIWGINHVPWIDPTFKQIIKIVAIIALVVFLLTLAGVWQYLWAIRIGR